MNNKSGSSSLPPIMKEEMNIDMSDIDFYRIKYEKAKGMLRCPLCKQNDKDTVLPCGHIFCMDCMN
jgi:hypothetical protein